VAFLVNQTPPCVLFEDDHLLVVNKPPGLNTHAPAPYAGEGIYDWLRHREARWASLAIVHRLDKETSGVLVFPKTTLANRSLTQQFTQRRVRKRYLLLTDKPVPFDDVVVRSTLVRAGDRYVSRQGGSGQDAQTQFRKIQLHPNGLTLLEAVPLTGRTHQIRVHAAERGIPILGDLLYGGSPHPRVCLHAATLEFDHPATGTGLQFAAPAEFSCDPRLALRQAVIDPTATNCYRVAHGAADRWPDCFVDRLGEFMLLSSETPSDSAKLPRWVNQEGLRGTYTKALRRQPGSSGTESLSPQLLSGEAAPDEFTVLENHVQYKLSFAEGYSVGLFLDQRDNRRRLLTNHVAAGFPLLPSGPGQAHVLNVFAYTCAFSVCAALGSGATCTSLDLSRKYLDWGRRNFEANGLDPQKHDFIFGDAFDWMRRLAKKQRFFDVILLDPPTFSRSRQHGTFQVENDYGLLVRTALPLLKPQGVLFASTNAANWAPESFLQSVHSAIHSFRRDILQQQYIPQPPDFPITRDQPAYLKTVWLRIG
jgi:23S rRNA (cytosine1962-C5)-methyltransferase